VKAGEYKILAPAAGKQEYVLRGVQLNGTRVRLTAATRGAAERLADQVFRPAPAVPLAAVEPPNVGAAPDAVLDDWGLPRVSAKTAAAVNAAVNVPRPAPEEPQRKDAPAPDPLAAARAIEAAEKQARRRQYASTFSELLGSGYAMGVGMVARRTRDADKYDVVKPSPKHLTSLADCTAEGIRESFGDREIGPWTMCGMMTIGIILSVFLQSTPKKVDKPELKSVP